MKLRGIIEARQAQVRRNISLDSLETDPSSSGSDILQSEAKPEVKPEVNFESFDDSEDEDAFQWDTSDFGRDISNQHEDDSEDLAPIPIISPLETAQGPLEVLVENGKQKVEAVEYFTKSETPQPTQIKNFNKTLQKSIKKADAAIGKV